MTHYSRLDKIVIDLSPDAHEQGVAFWAGALGRRMTQATAYPEYHWADLPGSELGLLTQRLEDGASRVHLDIHTDDLEAEVARLEKLGATRERKSHKWWIMRDPAGLPFCVIEDPPGRLNDGNATRWD
ncbi:VOC family protein [Thermoactinospora rubra]|uniref:VOC family protein n=1 Tax=Thermoactinospora rubra TaxID=1088767 RepID=UPI000A118000|nr:VOC family protein [Thermoactinospora rubra]